MNQEYTQKVEESFNKEVDRYNKRLKNDATGCQTVLQYLLDTPGKIWHWSWELMSKTNSKGNYLSHRAPARASDLALHTGLVEDRRVGRFKMYRIRLEKLEEINEYLK